MWTIIIFSEKLKWWSMFAVSVLQIQTEIGKSPALILYPFAWGFQGLFSIWQAETMNTRPALQRRNVPVISTLPLSPPPSAHHRGHLCQRSFPRPSPSRSPTIHVDLLPCKSTIASNQAGSFDLPSSMESFVGFNRKELDMSHRSTLMVPSCSAHNSVIRYHGNDVKQQVIEMLQRRRSTLRVESSSVGNTCMYNSVFMGKEKLTHDEVCLQLL